MTTPATTEGAVTKSVDSLQLGVPSVIGLSSVEAALAYAVCGWFVVPTKPDDIKNPGGILGGRWHENSSRDPEQIRLWWTNHPDAGIALHVGRSGAVAFDLDRDNSDGLPVHVWKALQRGQIQLTRHGGSVRGHYVFAVGVGEFGNSAGGFMRHGDVRGRNGVIMAAPTPHADGGLYRWTNHGPVGPLPDELRALLREAVDHADPKTPAELVALLDAYVGNDRPEALKGPLKGFATDTIQGASRHQTMCAVTTWAFREAIAGCYPIRQAYEQLSTAFANAKPEAEPGEFSRIVQWAAAQAEKANPAETLDHLDRTDIAKELRRLRVREVARERHAAQSARQRLTINSDRAVDGLTFLTSEIDVEPLWGSGQQVLWASGEVLMIAGPQGVGKSTVAQLLMLTRIGLADTQLFGFPVAYDERPVFYLAMDRPPQIRRSLGRMVDLSVKGTADTLTRQLITWQGPLPFDAALAPDVFAEWIKVHGREPGLVVVDSLKDLATGLAKDEVGAGINAAMQHVLANGTEVISLHHQRKPAIGNPKPDKLADVYGSSWLTAGVGSVLLLWGAPGASSVELVHLKQPQEKVGPLTIDHAHRSGLSVSTDPIERLAEIARVAGADGFTEEQAIRDLYEVGRGDDGYPSARGKTRRRLEKLTAQGFLVHDSGASGGVGGGGQPGRWTLAAAKRTAP